MTPYGRPLQTIPLGTTELPEDVFLDYLNEIAPKFSMERYDLFKNNCNNFCDECSHFLVGSGIPRHIIDLPNEVLATPMGKSLLQMMGGQSGMNIMDPRAMEGEHNPQQMHLDYGTQPPVQQPAQTQQARPGASAGPKPVSELMSQFDYQREIKENEAVVIDVFAEWCAPCQAIKPFFAGLPTQFPQVRFFKMDLDKNRFLGSSMGVQSIPTFLFIYKGQVVKKMTGADKNGLVNNVRWLISTYNLVTPSGGVAIGSQPAQKPVQKTVQVYSETPTPFYFDTEKWDLPMKKLREFGQKKNSEAFKSAEAAFAINFPQVEPAGQEAVINFALEFLPVDDADNLVPFLDFFRICLTKQPIAE
jgi:thiol-disulfide isomerase/thioredoxin